MPGSGRERIGWYFPHAGEVAAKESPVSVEQIIHEEKRILLVDDEEMIVHTGSQLLKIMGYLVSSFTSSGDAYDWFSQNSSAIDLVITDMTMPEMDGIELAKRMLAVRPDIAIVLCTGYNESLTNEKAIDAGIYNLLMKPFTSAELAEVLKRAFSEKK